MPQKPAETVPFMGYLQCAECAFPSHIYLYHNRWNVTSKSMEILEVRLIKYYVEFSKGWKIISVQPF